jgi:hypothetical protein
VLDAFATGLCPASTMRTLYIPLLCWRQQVVARAAAEKGTDVRNHGEDDLMPGGVRAHRYGCLRSHSHQHRVRVPGWWCCASVGGEGRGKKLLAGPTKSAVTARECTYLLVDSIAIIAGPSNRVVAAVVERRVWKAGLPRAFLSMRLKAAQACEVVDGESSIPVAVVMCTKSLLVLCVGQAAG